MQGDGPPSVGKAAGRQRRPRRTMGRIGETPAGRQHLLRAGIRDPCPPAFRRRRPHPGDPCGCLAECRRCSGFGRSGVARFRWGVPLPVLLGWTHPFAASGVPLLDKDRADEALTALLNFPASFPGIASARIDAADPGRRAVRRGARQSCRLGSACARRARRATTAPSSRRVLQPTPWRIFPLVRVQSCARSIAGWRRKGR